MRRCIEKETGREFAAKIIDMAAEANDSSAHQMLEATRQEIAMLRQVMGHPYISEYTSTGLSINLMEYYKQTEHTFTGWIVAGRLW